jgi:hypothetical protein
VARCLLAQRLGQCFGEPNVPFATHVLMRARLFIRWKVRTRPPVSMTRGRSFLRSQNQNLCPRHAHHGLDPLPAARSRCRANPLAAATTDSTGAG